MREFLERLGHKVVVAGGATWYDVQPRVLMTFPYYRLVSVNEETLARLMREHSLRALRFPTELSGLGFESSVAILAGREYGLPSLHVKSRNQTRRGLENCTVERIDAAFLLKNAMPLNEDTARRQGLRNQYVDPRYWARFCAAVGRSGGVEAWGAFWRGRLAAYLVSVEADGWVEWIVNHSLSEARQAYANNALVYEAARHYLGVAERGGIGYGLGSLEPTPDLDHFKARMGWQLRPIRQRLVLARSWAAAARVAPSRALSRLSGLLRDTYAPRKLLVLLDKYKTQGRGAPATTGATNAPDEVTSEN
jgi:hypothetical protein